MRTAAFIAATVLTSLVTLGAQSNPRSVADELLAADRAFASAAAKDDVVGALSAMFAEDVALTHAGGIAYGRIKAIEALQANPVNAGARIEWTPARVSISGDGRHGFTAGFMTLHRVHPTTQSPRRGDPGVHPTTQSPRRGDPGADQTTTPMKYLGYWEKQKAGWRLLAYKRGIAKTPAPAMEVTYVLPKQIVAAATDAATIERYRDSLADAERSFARDAQTMGIGPAFKHYGDPEAINLGGPDVATWLLGNEQVATGVGSGAPANSSPVNWGPEKTIVAASGDFGVTIGYIVPNKPGPDGKTPAGQPFFTIWKRSSPKDRWLYIAE